MRGALCAGYVLVCSTAPSLCLLPACAFATWTTATLADDVLRIVRSQELASVSSAFRLALVGCRSVGSERQARPTPRTRFGALHAAGGLLISVYSTHPALDTEYQHGGGTAAIADSHPASSSSSLQAHSSSSGSASSSSSGQQHAMEAPAQAAAPGRLRAAAAGSGSAAAGGGGGAAAPGGTPARSNV